MFSRFRRKRPAPEVSPGGSVVYRHDAGPGSKPQVGFAAASTAGFGAAREAQYGRLFGKSPKVLHETIPFVPHIDVFTFAPEPGGRDFFTLVTSGMSDLEMVLPPAAKGAPSRVELIFYCSEPQAEYLETLRRLAHFPHDHRTWLGPGHTLPNGDPPGLLWGSPVLDTFLFMPTIVSPDSGLHTLLTLAGQPVHFLWVVPLSTPECRLKLKKGFDAILDLFEKFRHPHVFDPRRKSYV